MDPAHSEFDSIGDGDRSVETAPTWIEWLQALAVCVAGSIAILGSTVWPSQVVAPFAPEHYEPWRTEAERAGRLGSIDLDRGSIVLSDKYHQSLAWDRIHQDRLRTGTVPRWSRDLGGGTPLVPQLAQPYQPWNLLLLIPGLESCGAYGLWLLLHHVVIGMGAWLLLRRIDASQAAACFAACCAILGLWTQARTHHNVILSGALPLFPLSVVLIDGMRQCARSGSFGRQRIAGVSLLLGLSLASGFAQVSMQVGVWVVGLSIVLAAAGLARPHTYAALRSVGLAVALGAALAAIQIVPSLRAAMDTARPEFAAEFLAHRGVVAAHLGTMLWPDWLFAPASMHSAPLWSALHALDPTRASEGSWAETAFGIGTVATLSLIFGSVMALLRPSAQRPIASFAVLMALFAWLIASGSSPVFDAWAALRWTVVGDIKRYLFLVAMALIPLAALGLDHVVESRSLRRILAVAALVVLGWSSVELWPAATLDNTAFLDHEAARLASTPSGAGVGEDALRTAMTTRDFEPTQNRTARVETFGRSALVTLAIALACLLLRGRRLAWILIAITAAELAHVGRGLAVPIPVERITTPPTTLEPALSATRRATDRSAPRPRFARLLRPEPLVEALRLLPPNLAAYHGLEDVFAYQALPDRSTDEFWRALEPDTWITSKGAGGIGFFQPESLRSPWLDVLGIDFVLTQADLDAPSDRFALASPAGAHRGPKLWRKKTASLSRAMFVPGSHVEVDAELRLARILGADLASLTTTTTLQDPDAPNATGTFEGTIHGIEHHDELVVVRFHCTGPGYLRLADPYDDGWRATLDGAKTRIWRADHWLRAVFVPESGEHEVVFTYDAMCERWPIWDVAARATDFHRAPAVARPPRPCLTRRSSSTPCSTMRASKLST